MKDTDKPQTFRKVVFTDGSFARFISNIDPLPGEPIIARVDWLHGSGTFPLEIIDAILKVWQWHADCNWRTFEQAMTLPGGRVVCWRFRPQEPCAVCLQSATGEGLFDAPPSKLTPETAEDFRAALRRAISPEEFATSIASLPVESQAKLRKQLADPPVRRVITFTTTRRKSKP